ncbi:hypothetical protein MYCTH_2307624 [Thermothelomyces thermophilus ATCC 42464]|uniref:Aminoglycoside phosphotransferase domain-containing protein n=1 Tax=Thermothelomyces thermophilus (strain ATCC 42464 / BCRC 31852 / DSM 1799) TaxID=573729 RepID=G2QGH2_THET4|nr:uncharacterized protein MYCTH_2307624 [Thermothelomyces thermophilus ATCC 42464]AEO59382.1 hypothetical protein MYCTH_2307624 [Thermothelomyces thermophilus ATCC 42464]
MAETNNRLSCEGAATPAPSQKRDREYGMCVDPLVDERSEDGREGFQRKLTTLKEEGRLLEIYGFILKYRPGRPVRLRQPIRGGYNAAFCLEYADGAAVLRVALPGVNAFAEEKVRVEVATLRYIERMTSIPVPHVYHWGTAAESPLGLGPFIIMDYIPHKCSLADILQDPSVKEDPGRQYLDRNVPGDKLERLYGQVARIMLELSRLEMSRIGSLAYDEDRDAFTVGSRPLTQDMNELVVQGGVPPCVLPPEPTTYASSREWYEVLADLHVAHLTFQRNQAIESADDCRDKFVARFLFRQLVRQGKLLPDWEGGSWGRKKRRGEEKFKLWIDDFRPHNILVDADLNVVGVIDWEWAYFAPASFRDEPPWWLLLGRPELWRGTVLDWRDEFSGVLDVFCRALDHVEEKEEEREEKEDDGKWSIDQRIDALGLDAKEGFPTMTLRLSERMRQSWDSGTFWANYAARRCYGFDPVFWDFLDERFFRENAEGGFEGRMHLLPDKVRRRMQSFVDKKVEDSKEEKIDEWEPQQAREYLAEILADLD